MHSLLSLVMALQLAPVSGSAPNRQPQLASVPGFAALVFGSGNSVWFAGSIDNGASFSTPVKIGELPKLMLGRHRGPRVAIAGHTILVSAIPAESNVVAWRSIDHGRTWSSPAVLNRQNGSAREGLHAMAADPEGHVAVAWLDARAEKGQRLYGVFSDDSGATWSADTLLYQSPSGTICECCHPSLAALGNGEFAVMWRNSLDGSRDLYAMRLKGGKPVSEAGKQGSGTWKLEACPMDGGGLTVRDGSLVSVWRRERDVYIAEEAKGNSETRIAAGQDAAIAATRQGVFAIWSASPGIELLTPAGGPPRRLSGAGAFPAIAALADGSILAAWEDDGRIAVQSIPVR